MLALNNLILKSKKFFGACKTSEILENQTYAWELLLQASTSESTELRFLAKEVNQELMIAPNLLTAINNYIEQIYHDKKSTQFISHSQQYVKLFAKALYDITPNNDAYREASSVFLSSVDKKDRTFCVNLVRSFFTYWKSTNKDLSLEKINNTSKISDHTQELTRLWNDIDTAFITTIEEALLTHYQQAVKKINILEDEIKLRAKIAKVIIIRQRKYNKTPEGYRENITSVQSVFSNKDLLNYFLSVSREFYHSWENVINKKG